MCAKRRSITGALYWEPRITAEDLSVREGKSRTLPGRPGHADTRPWLIRGLPAESRGSARPGRGPRVLRPGRPPTMDVCSAQLCTPLASLPHGQCARLDTLQLAIKCRRRLSANPCRPGRPRRSCRPRTRPCQQGRRIQVCPRRRRRDHVAGSAPVRGRRRVCLPLRPPLATHSPRRTTSADSVSGECLFGPHPPRSSSRRRPAPPASPSHTVSGGSSKSTSMRTGVAPPLHLPAHELTLRGQLDAPATDRQEAPGASCWTRRWSLQSSNAGGLSAMSHH